MTFPTAHPRVLVIDDDPDMIDYLQAVIDGAGFDTQVLDDAAQLDAVYRPDLCAVVLDLMMPGVDGVEVIRALAEHECHAGLIIVSGSDRKTLLAAEKLAQDRQLNWVGTLQKPFVPENLHTLLNKARLSQARHRMHRHPVKAGEATLPTLDELVIMFQPKINMQTLDFASVEALVRWQHPTKGLLAPGFFLPAAESSGQIDALTDMIVQHTLSQCTRWMQDDLVMNIAINVSARTLGDVEFPDRLERALQQYQVSPKQITLEVTETWLSDRPVDCLDSLTRLSMKGFNLSIDDFGTGYSSIAQLSRIPFTELKIDRSFVQRAPTSTQAQKILRSSVELGHHLSMKVVAEGVETQEQWNLVKDAGCDECQGFFIARPLPAGSTPGWLTRWQSMQRSRRLLSSPKKKPALADLSDTKM